MSNLTRRGFLQCLGTTAGASAVYGALNAMGLLVRAPSTTGPLRLSGSGEGRRVILLGAGLAGMCAAYELGKLDYDCRILEARTRVGGRCHTIRRGTVETETDGKTQTCDFDEGLYFNPGPARIPPHHCTLDYCRELGVAIEPFCNVNGHALVHRSKAATQPAVRMRIADVRGDMSGYIAELLAKAVHHGDLDQQLSREDKERIIEFLAMEGELTSDLAYRGRRRTESETGAPAPPDATLHELLGSSAPMGTISFGGPEQRPVMFQIVGGTDRLAAAFERRLHPDIELGAKVTEIRQSPQGVRILYTDRIGRPQQAQAEFCICTIPLGVLKSIPADFSPKMSTAVKASEYESACKVGLQFKRRFWEEDEQIYSGITHTDLSIMQIFYPSCGYLSKKGVIVGCYNFDPAARSYGALTAQQRVERALDEGSQIHPQYLKEFECGHSVAWHRVPYTLGAWASHGANSRRDHYATLGAPDGRIYLAGEHISDLTGWMAGALESARRVSAMVHERASREPAIPATKGA
ncbi:MAG: flavin monoamine oxidase family protein [Tepidisphaeraceae bacterium]